jgi:outer membrane protein assembly factor BamB
MPGGEGGPGRRDALIIAAGRYQDPELAALRSPSRDAAELAAVLGDEAIGGFGARVLVDEPGHLLREEIDGFFADRRAEDLLVLYLSCHGVKDVAGQLHFAVSTTKLARLASTGISAGFVYEQADRCRARRVLLLLDCCYSGAYLKGHQPKAGGRAEIGPLDGRGRAVITSCTALEYAFEIDTGQVTGTAAAPSVFTFALVEGLRTGQADRDGDGLISVDELYAYVFDRVREATPHQTPEKKWGDVRGDFIIAKNPRPPARPVPPAASTAQTAGHARPAATTRRALLGLATASAAGLGIAAWDLTRSPATASPPKPKTTPAPTTLWTRPVDGNPGPLADGQTGTPLAVVDGLVYADSGGGLLALRATDGRKLWHAKNLEFLTAPAGSGVVYAATNTALYALRASDGRMIWQSPVTWLTGQLAMTPGVVYAVDEYGTVHALRASDGTTLWSFATGQGEPGGLAAAGDVVYTTGANFGASVYAVRAGTEIWSSPIPRASGPEIGAGIVYVTGLVGVHGWLHALRPADGTRIWSFPASLALLADGIVYAVNDTHLYALRASNGTKLWSFPKSVENGPHLAGNALYFSNGRRVYALRTSNGAKIWSFTAYNGIRDIATANDTTYIASNDLYALRASDGVNIWSYPVETDTITVAGGDVYFVGSTGLLYALR